MLRDGIECCEGEEGQLHCNLDCKLFACPLFCSATLNFFSRWPREGTGHPQRSDILEEARKLSRASELKHVPSFNLQSFVDDWNEDAMCRDYWDSFYNDLPDEDWD